jgi:hypothetical protein
MAHHPRRRLPLRALALFSFAVSALLVNPRVPLPDDLDAPPSSSATQLFFESVAAFLDERVPEAARNAGAVADGAAALVRALVGGDETPLPRPRPRHLTPTDAHDAATVVELTDADLRDILLHHRALHPSPSSSLAAPARSLAQDDALPCSGVGVPLALPSSSPSPSPSSSPQPPAAYACNGQPVSAQFHDAVVAARAPGGFWPAEAFVLSAALSGEGPAATANDRVINSTRPLPPALNLTTALAPAQQSAVASAANVSDVGQVRRVGQLLLSPALLADPLQLGVVLTQVGQDQTAAMLNDTVCGRVAAPKAPSGGPSAVSGASPSPPIPSPSPSPSPAATAFKCACPIGYTGASCEHPLHFGCALTLADPTWEACLALNGAGFQAPPRGEGGGGGGDGGGDVTLGGPGTVAVPASAGLLHSDAASWVAARPRTATAPGLPRVPPDDALDLASRATHGQYEPLADGDPPCLFLDASSGGKAAAAAQQPRRRLRLAVRVACGWQWTNVSSSLASGKTVVDPSGAFYPDLPPQSGAPVAAGTIPPLLAAARAALGAYSAPTVAADLKARAVHTCNGTVLTRAATDALLGGGGGGGGRASAVARGKGPPYFGLACVEATTSISYAVGPAPMPLEADMPVGGIPVPFALHRLPPGLAGPGGRSSPLAVRVRAVTGLSLRDTSLTALAEVPLTRAALSGLEDIVVDLGDWSRWTAPSAAHAWAGGRLNLEARVVLAPEGTGTAGAAAPVDAAAVQALVSAYAVAPGSRRTPVLVLSSVLRLAVDDVAYSEPTSETRGERAVRLLLSVGLPLGLVALAVWRVARWRARRKDARALAAARFGGGSLLEGRDGAGGTGGGGGEGREKEE